MASYRPDGLLRWKAIEAMGFLAKERAQNDPEYFADIIRRHVWAMNEEGGNLSWSAPEIIGSIIVNQPDLYGEFATIMIGAAIDEAIFQKGMFWSVAQIGKVNKELIEYFLPRLKEFLHHHDPQLVKNAQETLKEINEI